MRYLITGITGFVGPHLAKLLIHEGHEVHGLIRGSNGREADLLDVLTPEELAEIRFRYGDLTDYASLTKVLWDGGKPIEFDGVFHLAAQSHPPTSFTNPIKTYADNVMGSVNLFGAMPLERMLFCSTSEVYGNMKGWVTEDQPLQPVNPYGASKACIDFLAQQRGYLVTRAFSHTGPRRGYRFSISWDAFHLARGDQILPVGNLEARRVVLDVRDVVKAYYLIMQKGEGVYNVCGDTVRPMSYFTDKLIEISGRDVEKKTDPKLLRPVDIAYQAGDTAKLKALGWEPEIPIEKTLEDLYEYWLRKLWGTATSC